MTSRSAAQHQVDNAATISNIVSSNGFRSFCCKGAGAVRPSTTEERDPARAAMDKDTQVSLHRSKVGRGDKMLKSGRFEDLYNEFAAVPSSTRSDYFMMDAGRRLDPQRNSASVTRAFFDARLRIVSL
jgi:hypothetical protein